VLVAFFRAASRHPPDPRCHAADERDAAIPDFFSENGSPARQIRVPPPRRTVLEETRAEQRQELVQNLEGGQVIDGVVKISPTTVRSWLGGIDGLLHVTDIAWRRVNHPSGSAQQSASSQVKIVKIITRLTASSLGIEAIGLDDPWQGIEGKYPIARA